MAKQLLYSDQARAAILKGVNQLADAVKATLGPLEDLGHKYGITKERTRQLEARIINRLREYLRKEVKDFDSLRQ